MTRIHGIHQIVSLIQGELAMRASEVSRQRESRRGDRPSKANRPEESAMADRLRVQLAAIEADAPDRRRRILRAFIESAMVAKFGEAMLLDPAFFKVVETVQQQMEQSSQMGSLIDSAVRALEDASKS